MSTAYFDKDGVCVAIADAKFTLPRNGSKAEAPAGSAVKDIWWDGEVVRSSEPAQVDIPASVLIGESALEIELPAGTVAIANGKRQTGMLRIETTNEGPVFVDLRGSTVGEFVVDVRGYSEARRVEYPSLADQIDALWKGGDAHDAMREQILEIKARHPKPGQ